MGFIDKSTLAVDAILTNKGRDYLRKAVFGENQNGEHIITKFALADDEIDYSLWDETVSDTTTFAKPYGQIIDNQPVTEPNVNWRTPSDSEVMRYFLFKRSIRETSATVVDEMDSNPEIQRPTGRSGGRTNTPGRGRGGRTNTPGRGRGGLTSPPVGRGGNRNPGTRGR